jgi:hypothetical protein
MDHVRNVKLAGNTVSKPGPYLGSFVSLGADVAGIVGNDATGITKK